MKKLFVGLVAAGLTLSALAQSSYTPVTREAPGGQNAFGQIEMTATTLSLTNGQVITLGEYPVILLDASGQGDVAITNTIAAASADYVGATYTFINVGASNTVLISDSAPVYNTAAVLAARDASVYFVKATNEIVQVSTSNN